MSKHHHSGDRRWRPNRYNNYQSQQEGYQDDGVTSAGPHRHGKTDQSLPFERDDLRAPEAASWEPLGAPSHPHFPSDAARQHRNDHQGPQPNQPRFVMGDRKSQSFWGPQEPSQAHYHDAPFVRDEPRPPHFHNKSNRSGPSDDVNQQWRGSQQEPPTEWRDRDIDPTPPFDRGRPGRRMDWESSFQQPWPEPHANGPNPGFQQHNIQHQESWNHPNQWQDNSSRWPQHQRRQTFDGRQPFNQQNRRNHAFNGHRQGESHNFSRNAQWDRSATNPAPANHTNANNRKDQRSSDDYARQSYQRKAEKRPHSRSASEDSAGERRRSVSPKRRRRESPPSSGRGVYKRRSLSRDSRYSDDRRDDRGPGKHKKRDGVIHKDSQQADKQCSGKRDRYTDDEQSPRYQRKDSKQKRRDSDRRRQTRSLSRSRSRTRSHSRSQSRSSSLSRGRRRDAVPTRKRSLSLSRSRSPPSPRPITPSKSKGHSVKHRLPVKSAPRMPLLKDVPLATTRAVLPSPPSGPRPRNQTAPQNAPGTVVESNAKWPPRVPREPSTDAKFDTSHNSLEPRSALSHFFPDAPRRDGADTESNAKWPALAPAEPSVVNRDEEPKKTKPKMVPIGGVQAAASKLAVPAKARETDMPPPAAPATRVSEQPKEAKTTTPISVEVTSGPIDGPTSPKPSPRVDSPSKTAPTTPRATSSATQPQLPERTRKPDDLYKILAQVGEGTFGKVYKARNQLNGIHVALKRIRMEGEKDGFPVTAMREIKLLQSLKHENVVKLHEMMVSKGLVYMVFEYVHHDLVGVLQQTQLKLQPQHLKALSQQMLQGLAYLHFKSIIHRDLKASNILVNSEGQLKLADFGLARFYNKRRKVDYTNRVITLWYRPPELLFGATVYGPEVDLWSAGCIFLELFVKKPTFQGNDEIHQLETIFQVMGTPSPEQWPSLPGLPWYELVKPVKALGNNFQPLFKSWLSPLAIDIAQKMLTFDPNQRVTASDALLHDYFVTEDPLPLSPDLSTLEGEWHELEAKRAKKKRKYEVESEPIAAISGQV